MQLKLQCDNTAYLLEWPQVKMSVPSVCEDVEELVWLKVVQLCLTLCDPMDDKSMEFSREEYWSG